MPFHDMGPLTDIDHWPNSIKNGSHLITLFEYICKWDFVLVTNSKNSIQKCAVPWVRLSLFFNLQNNQCAIFNNIV